MNLYQIIKAPLVSEKSMGMQEHSRYVFIVDRRADKLQIRQAVEKMFKVHVAQVNTVIKRGKKKRIGRSIGRKSNIKKAFVTLKQGETIKLFEGV